MLKLKRYTRKFKKILPKILILIISIIIFLILIELSLRLFYPQNLNYFKTDPILKYKGIPNAEANYNSYEFKTKINLNNHGLRDIDRDYNKNSYRILNLGDSFAFGEGVSNEETYSRVLENLLKKKGNYEVINAGMDAYGIDQSLAFLETEGIKYQPDIVILGFFVGNDAIDNLRKGVYDVENNKLIKKYPSYEFTTIIKIRRSLSSNSHLYKLASKVRYLFIDLKKGNIKGEFTMPFIDTRLYLKDYDDEIEFAWKKTLLLLDEFNKITQNNNSKFLIMLIPSKEEVDSKELIKFLSYYDLEKEDVDIYKPYNIMLNENKKYNMLDLLPEFKKRNKNNDFYFSINGHWNSKGHKLAAELIYETLINTGLVD